MSDISPNVTAPNINNLFANISTASHFSIESIFFVFLINQFCLEANKDTANITIIMRGKKVTFLSLILLTFPR